MGSFQPIEKRREERRTSANAMVWRATRSERFEAAWILEESLSGIAFARRGRETLIPGTLIDVQRNFDQPGESVERAIIRRVVNVHDDLMVIGAELMDRDNSPEQSQRRHVTAIEPKPHSPHQLQHQTKHRIGSDAMTRAASVA